MYLICISLISCRTHINNNKYLTDDAYYDELRRNLGKADINFKAIDALDLPLEFNGREFDVICLSNILDYFVSYYGAFWSVQQFYNYVGELEKLTKNGGTIFVNYIFDKFDGYTHNTRVVRDSMVFEEEIEDEFKIVKVPVNGIETIEDGLVLKRVKKGK